MSTPDSSPNWSLRLKRLCKAAGLRSVHLDTAHRGVNIIGRTREWTLVTGLSSDWLNVTTTVCQLPKQIGLRSRMLAWAMATNRSLPLAKFSVLDETLVLELDYRTEHVDDAVFGSLLGMLYSVAEEHYAKVFRIVNGDDVLDSLERSLEGTSIS